MHIEIDGINYEIVVTKKRGMRNTYFRVKKDLKLYVSTNLLVTNGQIKRMIEENIESITEMFQKQLKRKTNNDGFYYLGKKYEVVSTVGKDVIVADNKVFVGKEVDIEKWLRKQAEVLFLERLNYWHSVFDRHVPYPSLTIRKMTSRWGVCNSRLKKVTLNLELIKRDPVCLDYVIVHELSHFKEMNHSPQFWEIVEANYPNYRKVRAMMRNY